MTTFDWRRAAASAVSAAFGVRVFVSAELVEFKYVKSKGALFCPSLDTDMDVAQAVDTMAEAMGVDKESQWLSQFKSSLEGLVSDWKRIAENAGAKVG